jgi:excisionase family DNA binding protein
MADVLTVTEAAAALGTSRQSILNFLQDRTLRGRKDQSGTWRIRQDSVDRFLGRYGRLNGGRRRRSALAALQEEVDRLREVGDVAADDRVSRLLAERDDLRARVSTLEGSLASVREAAELQRRADAERARVVDELLVALGAAERADDLRRRALQALEDGLAASLVPGHPGSVR